MKPKIRAKIEIKYYKINQEPINLIIENKLEKMQELVSGIIEVVPLTDNIILVANEEGKIKNLAENRNLIFANKIVDTIKGNFFICRTDGDQFASYQDDDDIKIQKFIR